MARLFGATSGIDFGTGADINLGTTAFSATAWLKFAANFTAERMIVGKDVTGVTYRHYLTARGTSQNDFQVILDRATTDLEASSAANALTVGVWNFVGSSWDGSGLPKLYVATHGNLAAEPSYAAGRTAGSGAFTDTSTAPLTIGQVQGVIHWLGEIADVRLYNVVLSLAEIREVQFGLFPQPGARVFDAPLWGVENPEFDRAAGRRGTVTAAPATPHAPLIGYPSGTNPNKLRPRAFAPGLAR